ncbi:hypothetical protein ADUPG1_007435 [Aduncisulcus paluster]|uniref:Uncharacterized protein n=1 Tax=Aduncisulcus paluster TaxID=2918883 RepID=A0ABQ5KM48_9EUKA|nr:hypothetical protein ADUPG1_007435 [Aduncisulcus paluster]
MLSSHLHGPAVTLALRHAQSLLSAGKVSEAKQTTVLALNIQGTLQMETMGAHKGRMSVFDKMLEDDDDDDLVPSARVSRIRGPDRIGERLTASEGLSSHTSPRTFGSSESNASLLPSLPSDISPQHLTTFLSAIHFYLLASRLIHSSSISAALTSSILSAHYSSLLGNTDAILLCVYLCMLCDVPQLARHYLLSLGGGLGLNSNSSGQFGGILGKVMRVLGMDGIESELDGPDKVLKSSPSVSSPSLGFPSSSSSTGGVATRPHTIVVNGFRLISRVSTQLIIRLCSEYFILHPPSGHGEVERKKEQHEKKMKKRMQYMEEKLEAKEQKRKRMEESGIDQFDDESEDFDDGMFEHDDEVGDLFKIQRTKRECVCGFVNDSFDPICRGCGIVSNVCSASGVIVSPTDSKTCNKCGAKMSVDVKNVKYCPICHAKM